VLLFSGCAQHVTTRNELPVISLEKQVGPAKKSASLRISYNLEPGDREDSSLTKYVARFREKYLEAMSADYLRRTNYLNIISVGSRSALDQYKAKPSLDFDKDLADYRIRIKASDKVISRTIWNLVGRIFTFGAVSEELEAIISMEIKVRSRENKLLKRYRYAERINFKAREGCFYYYRFLYMNLSVFEKQSFIYRNMFDHFLRDIKNDGLL